jgi:8-oxo-dGTP pyrophosphatase MutT (NUDIX family)
MILLYPRADALDFFLTRRTETVDTHKGQISLPGGAQEPGESLQQTALREASEELGIDPLRIEILDGPLTPIYVPVSGFRVTPFVGFSPERPDIVLAAEEVVEIIETPLELLLDAHSLGEEDWDLHGLVCRVPFFDVKGHKVWGATGMILSEFSEMLRNARQVT